MALKDEQKVIEQLSDLLWNPKIKKEENMPKKKTKPKVTKKKSEKEIKEYQKKEVLNKLYPNESAGSIARKFNVSRAAVLNQLRKHEINITTKTSPKVGKHRTDVDRSFHRKDYLEKQLKAGKTVHAISVECNCGFMQVKHFVNKYGLMSLVEQQREKAKVKKEAPKKKIKK